VPHPLVIACGALASELRAVLAADSLTESIEVRYLPANLHNRPERIVPALRELLAEHDPERERTVLVGYADCGTGGGLDRLLAEEAHLARLPGAHCYEFFAGSELFAALHDAEPGTFYLTDFLAKHFDALVWQGLGLDEHPELRDVYFVHYTRVVLLAQQPDPAVLAAARAAAERLGLPYAYVQLGLDRFADAVSVGLRVRGGV
jgi:hypothetical protein